jgi:hypothetical protein
LSVAADYLNGFASRNGSLMTTLMASAPLNFLTSRETLQPPPAQADFYQSLQNQEFDYLVLVAKSPIIWYPRPEYFEEFLYSAPEGMQVVYNVSSLQIYDSDFVANNWSQLYNDTMAILQKDGIHVGGNHSLDYDSGLILNQVFYPFQLNVTCTVSSLSDTSQLPGIFWNATKDFVGVNFNDNNWVISAFVNGNLTYYNKLGTVEPNTSYVVSLVVTSKFVSAFVNGNLIGTLSLGHLSDIGNVILKSTKGKEGVFSNVTVSQPAVSLIAYERDDA